MANADRLPHPKESKMIQFLDVINYYKSLSHQKEAIAYLQENIPQNILDRFTEIWRTPTEPESEPVDQQRHINRDGLELIKSSEGCVLYTYDDGVGVPTIGYGHTEGVEWGQTITQTQAEELLKQDLNYFEQEVSNLVTVPLTDNQFSALVSFAFNVGIGAFAESTLLRFLNQGDYIGASEQFGRWVNGGGEVMPGLVFRRSLERELFLTQE
jgi:GH24 family phage-related lysozyme (muramidase)